MITFGTTALTGVARIFSVTQTGFPGPEMIFAIFIEIGVIVFIPWYRLVVVRAKTQTVP